jgi:hypothetical protein
VKFNCESEFVHYLKLPQHLFIIKRPCGHLEEKFSDKFERKSQKLKLVKKILDFVSLMSILAITHVRT